MLERSLYSSSGIPKEELENTAGEMDVGSTLLDLLPPCPDLDEQRKMDGGMLKCFTRRVKTLTCCWH